MPNKKPCIEGSLSWKTLSPNILNRLSFNGTGTDNNRFTFLPIINAQKLFASTDESMPILLNAGFAGQEKAAIRGCYINSSPSTAGSGE